MDVAQRENCEQQAREAPDWWISVPLAWDHPARAELLQRAAAGRSPEADA
jgi:hypothetical protein